MKTYWMMSYITKPLENKKHDRISHATFLSLPNYLREGFLIYTKLETYTFLMFS